MPHSISSRVMASDSSAYTFHSDRAVSAMRGLIFSTTGPGTSALKSCMPPIPSMGRIAIENRMIPMPPSHWIMLRQNSIDSGSPSICFRTVEPVVVNPETVSKKASVRPVKVPPNRNGNDPKRDAMIQPSDTIRKPSRWLICLWVEGKQTISARPHSRVMSMEKINGCCAYWPYATPISGGAHMLNPRMISRKP